MRVPVEELCIRNIAGVYKPGDMGYMPASRALSYLRSMSGQDFGLCADKWREWFAEKKAGVVDGSAGDLVSYEDVRDRLEAIKKRVDEHRKFS